MMFVWAALGCSLVYLLLQGFYFYYWLKTPILSIPSDYTFTEGVTVVIVARNEERSIGHCLRGILRQHFQVDLFEIMVIDDHSTDATVDEIKRIDNDRIQLFELKDFPSYIHAPAFKKSGITLAVDKARFENIIVTDADCVYPEEWLRSVMYAFGKNKVVFQTAPVILMDSNSLVERMQEMEQLTLMLITCAGIISRFHNMANGANMAFRKSAFLGIKGFEGNFQYASGDDMFLIEKMRTAYPDQVSFIKSVSATVYTEGKQDWTALFKQRLRWAGKNKGLNNKSIQSTWYFIGAYHIVLVVFLFLAIVHVASWWPFITMLAFKWFADFLLISSVATFFRRTSLLKFFIPLQFFYTYYILRLGLMMMMGQNGDWERS